MNDTDELIQYIKDDNRELLYVMRTMDFDKQYTHYFKSYNIDWNKVNNSIKYDIDNATSNCILGLLQLNATLWQMLRYDNPDIIYSIKRLEKSDKLGCKYASYILGYIYNRCAYRYASINEAIRLDYANTNEKYVDPSPYYKKSLLYKLEFSSNG